MAIYSVLSDTSQKAAISVALALQGIRLRWTFSPHSIHIAKLYEFYCFSFALPKALPLTKAFVKSARGAQRLSARAPTSMQTAKPDCISPKESLNLISLQMQKKKCFLATCTYQHFLILALFFWCSQRPNHLNTVLSLKAP